MKCTVCLFISHLCGCYRDNACLLLSARYQTSIQPFSHSDDDLTIYETTSCCKQKKKTAPSLQLRHRKPVTLSDSGEGEEGGLCCVQNVCEDEERVWHHQWTFPTLPVCLSLPVSDAESVSFCIIFMLQKYYFLFSVYSSSSSIIFPDYQTKKKTSLVLSVATNSNIFENLKKKENCFFKDMKTSKTIFPKLWAAQLIL